MNKMYLFAVPALLITLSFVNTDDNQKNKVPSAEHWSVDVGKTSFRTNVSLTPSYLVIGSNGDNYRDAYITDDRNGVHIINRKTGKRVRNFAKESIGDLDVNGTLIYQNRIYFGNDNDEFICADFNGNIKYSLPVSGDVESEPVLIKRNGKDVMVFGTEAGEVRAIDPVNGETIWQHFHEKFKGWKMGDNRLVFKVKTHFSMTYLFLMKPIVKDLNSDGIGDIVYTMNGQFYSINGANGKILHAFDLTEDYDKWSDPKVLHNAFVDAETILFTKDKNGKTLITVPKYSYRPIEDSYRTDGYKFHMLTFDLKGNIIEKRMIEEKVKQDNFKRLANTQIYCSGDKVFQFDKNMKLISNTTLEEFEEVSGGYFAYFISDQLIEINQQRCMVILLEYEHLIAFVNIDSGKIVRKIKINGRSEFIPLIEDINKDGRMDLLFSDDSNQLSCIDLGKGINILNK
jgi:outer membrane protein assembly factor BamB